MVIPGQSADIKIEWNVQIPMLVLIKRIKQSICCWSRKSFKIKCFWSKLIIHQKALYDIFYEKVVKCGVKINDLCIGTENIFISPRLFF